MISNLIFEKLPKVYASNTNKITVSAIVLEQIQFTRNKEQVLIETNYEKGFWVISENNKQNFNKKTVLNLSFEDNIFIVAKF